MSRQRRWERRWAVYLPVSAENGPSMRDEGHPVFEDADGRWWAERVAERYRTRRAACRGARYIERSGRGMAALMAAASGGRLPVAAALPGPVRVGLAGEYSRSATAADGRTPAGRTPVWVWVAFAVCVLVVPVGLIVVDELAPGNDLWLLLASLAVGVPGLALVGVVLRHPPGGGR